MAGRELARHQHQPRQLRAPRLRVGGRQDPPPVGRAQRVRQRPGPRPLEASSGRLPGHGHQGGRHPGQRDDLRRDAGLRRPVPRLGHGERADSPLRRDRGVDRAWRASRGSSCGSASRRTGRSTPSSSSTCRSSSSRPAAWRSTTSGPRSISARRSRPITDPQNGFQTNSTYKELVGLTGTANESIAAVEGQLRRMSRTAQQSSPKTLPDRQPS